MTVLFDPLAASEYNDAYEYFEAQKKGLGEKFRLSVWAGISILEQFPEIGEEVRPGIRKILLKHFPYKLIYSVTDRIVYIIAVSHGHREPDYWIDRNGIL